MNPPTPQPSSVAPRKSRRRLGNLAGFLLAASVLSGVRAQAWVDESKARVLDLHRALFTQIAAQHRGETHVLSINGVRFVTQNGNTKLSREQVLATVQASCSPPGLNNPWHIPHVLQEQDDEEAIIVCLKPKGHLDADGLASSYQEAVRSGSISAFGEFQGAFVRATEDGGASLLAWRPEGEIPVAQMFPEHGDAPGADLPDVPRPAGRRMFSAALDDRPLVAVYAASEPQLQGMGDRLRHTGFRVDQQRHQDGPRAGQAKAALFAQDEKRSLLLVEQQNEEDHLLVIAEVP